MSEHGSGRINDPTSDRTGHEPGSADAIAARCEDLVLDTHLRAVREHREKTGKGAIGFLPVYVPRELIAAADLLPVGVAGGGDQIEIIRGDAYFQSYICQLPRSVIEMGLNGRLDVLDGMVFPATCDVIRNLSGMWRTLFPDKLVYYLDVPHNHDRKVGGRFYAEQLRALGRALAKISGVQATDERLREAIARYDENRVLLDELWALRADKPHLVPTSEIYVVMRAGYVLPVEEHNAVLRAYLDGARARDRRELDQARVLLVGAFCEQPPLGLLRTLERAGCFLVDDDLLLGARFLSGPVDPEGDPYDALAAAWIDRGRPTPSRYLPNEEKGRWLVEACREKRAQGVIFCAPSFCDPALLEQPMLQTALDAAGIPYTSFKYAENTAQFQSIREQSGTFADSILLWSEAS